MHATCSAHQIRTDPFNLIAYGEVYLNLEPPPHWFNFSLSFLCAPYWWSFSFLFQNLPILRFWKPTSALPFNSVLLLMFRRSLDSMIVYCPICLPFYAADFTFVPSPVICCNDASLFSSHMSLDAQLVAEFPEFLQFKNFANLLLRFVRWVLGSGTTLYSASLKAKGEVVTGRMVWIVGKWARGMWDAPDLI
jgi:hypothetical protein